MSCRRLAIIASCLLSAASYGQGFTPAQVIASGGGSIRYARRMDKDEGHPWRAERLPGDQFDSLICWLPFPANAGTNAYDYSHKKSQFIAEVGATQSASYGGIYNISGPRLSGNNPGSNWADFAVCAWVYATNDAANKVMTIVGNVTTVSGADKGWSFYYANKIIAFYAIQSASIYVGGTSSYQYDFTGVWSHLTAQKIGTSVVVYLNGVQVPFSKDKAGSLTDYSSDSQLTVGNLVMPGRTECFGFVDDVRVYNRPLTSNEVLSVYMAGSTNGTGTH